MTTATAPDPAATRIRRVANSVHLALSERDPRWLDICASGLIDLAGELQRDAARARYDQAVTR